MGDQGTDKGKVAWDKQPASSLGKKKGFFSSM
jgi:hypothetical protein